MTNQDKIKEIREGYKSDRDDNFTYKKEIVEQDIRFLLSELDREREEKSKHHDDVVKLREERDKLIEGLKDAIEFLRLLGVDAVGEDVLRKLVTICKEIGVTME